MDIPALKAFTVVAAQQSFSRAADLLNLTQPAISSRIRQLESTTGQRLFDRIGRTTVLTEAGRALLPYAHRILELAAASQQALDDLAGDVRGQLRLITSHHIGLHRLPVVLRSFKQRYPQVALHIEFYNSAETHQRIIDGDGDLGITTQEPVDGPLVRHAIWHDELRFVVAPDHPLATLHPLGLAAFCDYPAILPDARFYTGRVVRELFSDRGLELLLDRDLSTDYLETIKALLSIGQSWSVLPHTMLNDESLVALSPDGVNLGRKLVCIHHENRTLNRAALALLDILHEQRDQQA